MTNNIQKVIEENKQKFLKEVLPLIEKLPSIGFFDKFLSSDVPVPLKISLQYNYLNWYCIEYNPSTKTIFGFEYVLDPADGMKSKEFSIDEIISYIEKDDDFIIDKDWNSCTKVSELICDEYCKPDQWRYYEFSDYGVMDH